MTTETVRLAELEPRGSTTEALAFFDSLPALSASGWYGKQFDGVDAVHPLLFEAPSGDLTPTASGSP